MYCIDTCLVLRFGITGRAPVNADEQQAVKSHHDASCAKKTAIQWASRKNKEKTTCRRERYQNVLLPKDIYDVLHKMLRMPLPLELSGARAPSLARTPECALMFGFVDKQQTN